MYKDEEKKCVRETDIEVRERGIEEGGSRKQDKRGKKSVEGGKSNDVKR